MVLFKYFAKQNKTNKTHLPDPTGALSREVPSSAIVSANEVKKIASSSENSRQIFSNFSLPNALILVVATDHRLHNTAS